MANAADILVETLIAWDVNDVSDLSIRHQRHR